MNGEKFLKITYPSVPKNRYLVSENGNIFDTMRNRYISQYEDKDGYYRCTINKKHYLISRLVAYEFCPKNRDLSIVVDHVDGIKKHNHYSNLEWVTIQENIIRAQKLGLRNVRGEHSSTNVYPEEFIHDICKLLSNGLSIMEVFYKVTNRDCLYDKINMNDKKDKSLYNLIYHVRKKDIWPDVVSQYIFPEFKRSKQIFKPKPGTSRFTESQVHDICKMYVSGKSTDEIAYSLGLLKSNPEYRLFCNAIRSITLGRNWTSISSRYFESRFRKTGRIVHEFDDDKLVRLLDLNYSRNDIFREFGITDSYDDRLIKRAIIKRINNYYELRKSDGYIYI